MNYMIYTILGLVVVIGFAGIRIVRPMQKATTERLGKYIKFGKEGFNWIIPVIDRIVYQNISEQMMDIESFEAITKERLITSGL